ncbi:hypothetical protein CTEN210_14745 [Chaetoceros tenuissimus]|uniref:Reverse transcriptase n=1 Tax=Chaetoceros tenuissimus TaxID=426638 RepID=A0AAD3D5R2_9STRA|nr:hypothetical protein CTEN210_14745 [Chaetoceros tenuissimus]
MSDSNANTPIKMWPALDYADFVTIKLQQDFADGSYRKESLPTFDGEGGSTGNAEAFLYVRERFISAASNRKLNFDDLEKFENFEDVLKGVAQHYWTDTVSTHADVVAAANADKFQVAVNLMMIRFCGGRSGGDALLEYLRSDKVRKEKSKSVAEHVGRFCTLVGYAKELLRIVAPRPDDNLEKKLVFDSFPYQWKLNFTNSGAVYHEKSINEISEYMERQKSTADADTSKKRARHQDLKNQKFKQRKKGNRRGQTGGFRNQCTRHEPPHNNHEWEDCILNPRSANFRGDTGSRGRGNGYGGRGRGNGGGRGHHNHSNHNNNGGQSYNSGNNQGHGQNQNYNYQGTQNNNNANTRSNPENGSNQQGSNGSNEQHFLMDNNNVWGAHHGVVSIMNSPLELGECFWEQEAKQQFWKTPQEEEEILWEEYFATSIPMDVYDFISSPPVEVEASLSVQADQMKKDPLTAPVSLLQPRTINGHRDTKLCRTLFDSGGTCDIIHRRALPKNCPVYDLTEASPSIGIGGTVYFKQYVILENSVLPEFGRKHNIEKIFALVHDGVCPHDIILGQRTLAAMGLVLNYQDQTMSWMDITVSMKSRRHWNNRTNVQLAFTEYGYDDEMEEQDESFILESKYDKVSGKEVADAQQHLSEEQRKDLHRVLDEFTTLFDGQLKVYPDSKVHLHLKPDAQPRQSRPYKVPYAHEKVFKEELDRLVQQGVLSPANRSIWTAPTFIIPKKDGRVRWVSDFRYLNKNLQRKQYELPRIKDILERRKGYKFFTKLDISMQYYTFELDEESKNLCTITTPFGMYKYNRLPMGILESPDIAQEIMENVLRDEDCEIYIDDIGIFSDDWNEHVGKIQRILKKLQDHGFTMNPLKCEWAVQETDWLGHWLTPSGLKPWSKKIKPLLAMQPPKNVKQVRSFIGAVNFYKDMWQRRAHLQKPLTDLLKTNNFHWGTEQQQAFEQIKATMAKDVLLFYPDHNQPFFIYTDSSDYQLGATLAQHDADGNLRPVAFFSKKLNAAQRNYPTGEKEFLSIFETLKTYRTMLLGAQIHIYTDHKNLTYKNISSQRMLRWRMYIEEFGPQLHFIPGEVNTCADYFSRMEVDNKILEEKSNGPSTKRNLEESFFQDLIFDDLRLAECFANLPLSEMFINVAENAIFPLDYNRIALAQQQDMQLAQLRQRSPADYSLRQMNPQVQLVMYKDRIFVPTQYSVRILRWYHNALNHCGEEKLKKTFNENFFSPRATETIKEICSKCEICQVNKTASVQYGHLPPRTVTMNPWHTVAVDLIGPWKFKVQGVTVEFHALTMVDQDTNLVEAVRIQNKHANHIATLFENNWLSRYPRPVKCIHDQGGEFTGSEFQEMLNRFNIRPAQITTRNPQGNSICERMHQTMLNQIRSLLRQHPPQTVAEATQAIDTLLANTVYALRTAVHSTMNASPGALAFQRNMILNLPFIVDLNNLRARRQEIVDRSNQRENDNRIDYNYQVGNWVLVIADSYRTTSKLDIRFEGPFQITQVHVNGNVTIRRRPGILERVNIRRIRPYRR